MDPFREEFALLNATCARNVRLELVTAAGVSATLLNDYVVAGESASDVEFLVAPRPGLRR
jgi:hypothetical protein